MGLFKKIIPALLLFLTLLSTSKAQPFNPEIYKTAPEGFPAVQAILAGCKKPRALIYYKKQAFNLTEQMSLDNEWAIEEIRRESVLFKRTSTCAFAEIYLNAPIKAKWHSFCSFFAQPISLWQALELLAYGFGYQAAMHCQSSASVVPACHGSSIQRLLQKIIPKNHVFKVQGPIVYVLPKKAQNERADIILKRLKSFDANSLTLRYEGLNKHGSLVARGSDIQYVLRQISLGSNEQISFPKDMHFRVYAAFRDISFAHMLAKIAILNQCVIYERENCLEVCPALHLYADSQEQKHILSAPSKPFSGSGPVPPPVGPIDKNNKPF